ncbi:TIGR03936 family radical SAM-associated protein [Jatrophihabitans sp. YIM 134969]
MQRVRLRYTKRDRMRFASHRDLARALERAIRRAGVPIAFSAGFTPHPKISYVGAAPTGTASEAEYLEIGLAKAVDVDRLREALDAALPTGVDLVDAVEARTPGFADRMEASAWSIEFPGAGIIEVETAVSAFAAAESVTVQRTTKSGVRDVDARAAVVHIATRTVPGGPEDPPRAILDLVVRQVIPAVRPDDVLAALRALTGFVAPLPPRSVRVAQGPTTGASPASVGDPLDPDREASPAVTPGG